MINFSSHRLLVCASKSVHKIWFYLCRPVRRQEVRSAAFKQGTGQMFQFSTWRTGSADAKGTKRLLGIVTTLRFLLPPPTLNLLPWSWTVWTRAVKLLCDQREPSTCKSGAGFLCDSAGPSLLLPGLSRVWRFGAPLTGAGTARLHCPAGRHKGECGVCFRLALLLSLTAVVFGVLLTLLLTPGR